MTIPDGSQSHRYRMDHQDLSCVRPYFRQLHENARVEPFKVSSWPKDGEELDLSAFQQEADLLKTKLFPEIAQHRLQLEKVLTTFDSAQIKDFLANKPWRPSTLFT